MSLDLTKQRLESSVRRVEVFIDQNISTWATEEILLPAQIDLANSISNRASQSLSLEKSGWMKTNLVWDLRGDNGEPLHFYLEFGTEPHIIEPKGRGGGGSDVLAWKGPSGGFVIGKTIFATKVKHPGSKKHVGIIKKIVEEREPNLVSRVVKETTNFLEVQKI